MKHTMQSISVILASMAAAVSAIDIRLENSGDCSRNSGGFECLGWNPDQCCGIPSGVVYSIGFYGIPVDWNLETRGYEGGFCNSLKTIDGAFNTNFECLNQGPYTGAGYGFKSRKPRRGVQTQAYSEECKPDRFVAEDGKKYSLSTLSTDQLVEFVEQTGNGTVPETYAALEIVE